MDRIVNSTAGLGRVIRDSRKRLGLSQAALATRVGMHQPTISNIERGAKHTSSDAVLRLMAALQLQLVIREHGSEDLKTPWSED